jgi:Protein of unknown function (DUF2905)
MRRDRSSRETLGGFVGSEEGQVPQRSPLGLWLILVGVGLVVIGVLVRLGALSWFGRLPGDIRIERPGVRVYVPITSMVIISVVLSAIGALIRRLWR